MTRRHWVFLCLLPAFIMVQGCGACRKVSGVNESLKEVVQVIEHSKFIPVLTSIEIPEIRESVRIKDSVSVLENQYAKSTAMIYGDGTLYHDLDTKPQTIRREQQVQIEYRDSIVFRDREVEKVVEVERKLTAWQEFRIKSFWILIALMAFSCRKIILALLKRFA